MSVEDKNEEIIRQILDDKSHSSLSNLKHINKEKYTKIKDMILNFFNTEHRRMSYNEYLTILNKLEEITSTTEIRFKRKNDLFDLSDIE